MTGGVVDLANAGFDEDREPETECQTCIRVFWCQTCHDTGEIEVMTQGLGPDDYTETIACPDCSDATPPSTGDPLAKLCSDQAAKITAQRTRIAELADDADRLKALWLYPPADIAFWKVAYPDLEDFRRAIDGYTKKAQDEKWGYPS